MTHTKPLEESCASWANFSSSRKHAVGQTVPGLRNAQRIYAGVRPTVPAADVPRSLFSTNTNLWSVHLQSIISVKTWYRDIGGCRYALVPILLFCWSYQKSL